MSKTVRIGIDGQEANVLHRVGSNTYAYELIKALYQSTKHSDKYHVIIFTTHPPVEDMPQPHEHWEYHLIRPKPLATQWGLPLTLHSKRDHLDVFFSPGHYAPRFSPVPYVSCVMDLAYLKFPKQFKKKDYLQLKHWTQYSIKRAQHVIVISDSTKKDVQAIYKVPNRKMSTVYPSLPSIDQEVTLHPEEEEKILHKWFIKEPYILYVGTLQPRKNIERLIEGYEKMYFRAISSFEKSQKKRNKKKENEAFQLQLVLAGKMGWLSQPIMKRIQQSPLKQHIILTGFVTEVEKQTLYKHAVCSALVGLYEGFGIPILESLYFNTVPVVAKVSSLPEAAGEAGMYVNPEDTTSIARGLEQAFYLNQKQKRQFEKAAKTQLKKFSWQKSAEKVLKILEKVAGGK